MYFHPALDDVKNQNAQQEEEKETLQEELKATSKGKNGWIKHKLNVHVDF